MTTYAFFKTDDCRQIKYFDLAECDDDAGAVLHARAMMARDHHSAIEVWDGDRSIRLENSDVDTDSCKVRAWLAPLGQAQSTLKCPVGAKACW